MSNSEQLPSGLPYQRASCNQLVSRYSTFT
jgi:hypothetical protein